MRGTKRETYDKRRLINIEVEQIRNGYTQDEISDKLGITRKTYQNWLNNGNIPIQKLIELSDFFDCSVDYLLGRSDSRRFAVVAINLNE